MIEAPPLPEIHAPPVGARIVDGVLEVWAFDIARAEYAVRHDAIVNGRREAVFGMPIRAFDLSGEDLQLALAIRRRQALIAFQELESSR